jgi:purine nucleosidase
MPIPAERLTRVIIDTDAKNEADDQYCIVQALLTPSFELHGIIPAHFGTGKSPHSMRDSADEVKLLRELMGLSGGVTLAEGGEAAIWDARTPSGSPGAELIIREAMNDDPRPLHVAFLGPLTDMASALIMEPRIARRNVKVIWIGGGEWPVGGPEYNLSNDIEAANVVFRSDVEVWQIPQPVYRMMGVSYAELMERVHDKGAIGKYLVEQLIDWNTDSTRVLSSTDLSATRPRCPRS